MDFLEIMTEVRNITGLHSEKDLGTQELMRYINSAYMKNVVLKLGTDVRKSIYKRTELTDQTGETVAKPTDAEVIIDVTRATIPCIECPYQDKSKIGNYKGEDVLQYPDDDTDHPVYVDQGSTIRIYPDLNETDVIIGYMPRVPGLIYGKGTVSTTSLTLDGLASARDDVYNDYEIALYSLSGTTMNLSGIYSISDYDGSTKVATLASSPGDGTYYYALIPVIPEFFHTLITQAALIELANSKLYEVNPSALLSEYLVLVRTIVREYRSYSR